MEYSEITPNSTELSQYIDCLWTNGNPGKKEREILVLPETGTDIVLLFNPSKEPELFIIGEMTKAAAVPIFTDQRYLGIRFKPGFLSPLIDVPMSELTDLSTPLKDINFNFYDLFKPLLEITQEDLQLQQVQSTLQKLIRECDGIDPIIEYAMSLIIKSNGMITVRDLSAQTGYSSRQLQRLFLKTVGLPPKLFARIIRFQQAQRNENCNENYYDQSHFLREFKEFTIPSNQ